MKPSSSSPSENESIEATAAAWLAQRDDGFDARQQAEFDLWCAADPRHAATVERLETTWELLTRLRAYRPEARAHPDRDLLARPPARRARFHPALAVSTALAASLIAIAAWWWQRSPHALDAIEPYATTAAGYQLTTLSDQSVVELNADSEIRVHYTTTERRVQLVRGEAHFAVTKDKTRPFRVAAGAVTVQAVGTAFNVRLTESQIEVLVTEGKVQVERPSGASASPTTTFLEAGQRLVIGPAQPAPAVVEKIAPVDMRDALAWQDSRLYFSNTALAEVVQQFNQHNALQLELADPVLATMPVGGNFRAKNVEAFIRFLEDDTSLTVDRSQPGRILLHKNKTP